MATEVENLERRWEDAISALTNGKVPFAVTSDVKRLLRLGIPISQRVSATIIHVSLFFVSCCVCDEPETRKRPFLVGHAMLR